MSEPIITVSGFRGVVGETLTPQMAMRFVGAFAEGLPAGTVVVTRDSRRTGPMLADAVRSVLCAVGRTVIDAGITATPTTGVLVRQHRSAGGVQISASHNPAEYNGMKLFNAEGRILTRDASVKVAEKYHARAVSWVRYQDVGTVEPSADALHEHESLILATVDVDRIRKRRLRVLLDCNHGAAGPLAQRLLDKLGCRVTVLGAEPTGDFLHRPEPTEENLRDVCRSAQHSSFDVGFCPDPDGDRLAVLDEKGRYIGEEFTLALCVAHVLRDRPGTIVANTATSRMSEYVARQYGERFYRAAVGEANVVEVMRRHKAVFGGEGNGGPIDPRVGFVRDSFVGIALILDAMAGRDLKLSQLVAELPQLEIRKHPVSFDRTKLPAVAADLNHIFKDAAFDDTAGYRFDWEDKWLLLHASNTEPIVRVIAEAGCAADVETLCGQVAEVMERLNN